MNILNSRASGILMHISSLPSEGGIGTLGSAAYSFVDSLRKAHQTYWQILPICPTSYGDSPYQSFSTYAGNPYFIDLELLEKEGYLSPSDWRNIVWCSDEKSVDYGLLYTERYKVFRIVQNQFEKNPPVDFDTFCKENAFWLEDYALFMAIKDAHGGETFLNWEDDIRLRKSQALTAWKKRCEKEIRFYKMLQYLFFAQWKNLKDYANKNGIKIIGDIPIYVSSDSADVWASPNIFYLNENGYPIEVAGCPPDGFAADGQLWGNPVYNWTSLRAQNYRWWLVRLSHSFKIYDVLRIDHFRGFESYYCIPYGDRTARNGVWKKGPGIELFNLLKEQNGDMSVIAEDLGFLTREVHEMRKTSGFPGMKVLQFAFDSREENDYLPEHYEENSVVYTGTHDNDTLIGWTEGSRPEDVETALKYFGIEDRKRLPRCMMKAALDSVSNTCILTMQDVLELDGSARMNTPSTLGSNWKWRATEKELSNADWNFLREETDRAGRY